MLLIPLLKGIAVGIVIALPAGPVGVLCVRRALFGGPLFGLVSGIGAATADAMFGMVAAFGLTIVSNDLLAYQDWLGAAGGIFLVVIGIRALFLAPSSDPEPVQGEAYFAAYVSTFALTISNPITILAFAAIFAKLGASEASGIANLAVLVAGIFLGSLVWWLGLSFGIAGLRRWCGRFQLLWLNRGSGVILIVSGIGLLIAAALAFVGKPL